MSAGRERVELRMLPDPAGGAAGADGPVSTVQAAEFEVPLAFLDEVWGPEYLERLARSYWEYLERISLGILRVEYGRSSRTVVLLHRRLPLLRFRRPQYETATGLGQVTWPIERGILVAPGGRGRGFLRITVRRLDSTASGGERHARIQIAAAVSNFYPGLRFGGQLARIGAWFYNQTQMRIHVLVTRGFLRSLARLEFPRSRVGALLAAAGAAAPGER